jgi:hypothetical protein
MANNESMSNRRVLLIACLLIAIMVIALITTALALSNVTKMSSRFISPDQQACLLITTREKHEVPLPGPEPPKTLAKSAQFVIEVKGKKVYDSGFQNIGVYQPLSFAFDVAWAPDSEHVAYRSISQLQIADRHGKVLSIQLPGTNALISSFKWISTKELLIVVKEIDEPLNLYGYPQHYHGYLAHAEEIKIVRVHLDTGVTQQFSQNLRTKPTFIFHSVGFVHSIGFENQEISPYSNRVAFSDGLAICVYDDDSGQVIAKVPVNSSVEGVWWETKDKLILGLGLLSSPSRQFVRLNLVDGKIEDCTQSLLPLWTGQYDNINWFRPAIGKQK